MTRKSNRLSLVLALIGFLTLASPGRAQIVFSLVQPEQTAMAGTTIGFDINLLNGSLPSQITGFTVAFDGPSLPVNPDPFDNFLFDPGTPDPLPFNYRALGLRMFDLDLSSAAAGFYRGAATISYTTDGITDRDATAAFQVTVTPSAAPEPPSVALTVLPLLGLAAIRRRPRGRSQAG